ncbi:zinc finger HIT domain-containing protein 2 [Parasteatoda tepidariorum]|uniref:zinc finger HIT domain-containing protein 2 n=1 Tax=Parasteatoda tepidariorum TaxID=114398 RepID=UPI00077FB734|nr:zinc finger HIT domain-containing protein 2-like [Parasteatoda tepidariorum]
MSLSKVAQKCRFCGIGSGIYTCPRCSCKYCSSYCYKNREHDGCVELFFQEWVEQTLRDERVRQEEEENMRRIIQNFEKDELNPDLRNESVASPIEERFADLNLNSINEHDIWEKLNADEKSEFESFIKDKNKLESIVSLKQPWWTSQILNLVSDFESDSSETNDDVAERPPFPLNFKKLSEMTSAKPSECIPLNLINILYAYAFLCRFFNCELRDFLAEVVDLLFVLSPVLSEGKNYSTLDESVQDSIRLIMDQQLDVPISFVKSIVNDVSNIMLGPSNARSSTFVLCALHDIKLIFNDYKSLCQSKKDQDKAMRKKLTLLIKKIEYFIAWSSEFETAFSGISSDLLLLMLPDLMPESTSSISEEKVLKVDIGKPLIEEVN